MLRRSFFLCLISGLMLLASCAYDDGTYDNGDYEAWGDLGYYYYYDDYYSYYRPTKRTRQIEPGRQAGPREAGRGVASVRMRRGDQEFYNKCLRRNGVYRSTGCYCPGAAAFFNPFTHRCQDY